MPSVDKLTKRFGLFILIYFVLVIISLWSPIGQMHNVYFSKVGKRFFNVININYHTEWIPKAPANAKDWNTTIKLYALNQHGSKASNKKYQKQIQPSQMAYNNFYAIAFLPLLFLIALYLVTTDLRWQEKLWRFAISWIILNIFIAFHISHILENVMANQGEVGDTFWQKTIALFGFYGLDEGLYIIASVSWAVMVLPRMKTWVG